MWSEWWWDRTCEEFLHFSPDINRSSFTPTSSKHVSFVVKSWRGCTAPRVRDRMTITGVHRCRCCLNMLPLMFCGGWAALCLCLLCEAAGRWGQAGFRLKECCSWIISSLRVILYLHYVGLWDKWKILKWMFDFQCTVVHTAVWCFYRGLGAEWRYSEYDGKFNYIIVQPVWRVLKSSQVYQNLNRLRFNSCLLAYKLLNGLFCSQMTVVIWISQDEIFWDMQASSLSLFCLLYTQWIASGAELLFICFLLLQRTAWCAGDVGYKRRRYSNETVAWLGS